MVDINKYSFSDPFNRGIDFYTIDGADVIIDISGSGSLVVNSTAIRFSSVTLSALADMSTTITKTTFASVDLSGLSVTVTVATERQDALVDVSANTTLTVNSIKISTASVTKTRTNLVTNPNFEVDIAGWVGRNGSTPVRTTAQAVSGIASMTLTTSASVNNGATLFPDIPITVGESYTWSGYAKADTGTLTNCYVSIIWLNSSAVEITRVNGTFTTLSTSWQRLSVSGTAPVGAVTAQCFIARNTAAAGFVWYADAFLLETGSSLLPYFDGAGVAPYTGYTLLSTSWNGATNASTSTSTWTTISASADLVSNSIKISISSSTLSSNSSLTVAGFRIVPAVSAPSGSASLSVGATKIRYAAALLSGSVSMSTAGRIVLATIRIQLFENATVSAEIIKFSAVTGVDTSSIRTLLLLDGKPLTNQNRTLDVTSAPVFIENRNWNASSSRYYKNQTTADKKSFSLNWSFIPNFMEKTVDNKYSRDYIRKISKDPDVHTLTIINSDSNGLTPYTETVYTVLVKDFNESLIRRDVPNNTYYFNCSMTLEEV